MSCIVVKLGGNALDDLSPSSVILRDLADDVRALVDEGFWVVVVHGGGPQISDLLTSVNVASSFHEGLRVTSPETMTYVAMALDQVNASVVAAFGHAGLAAVGVSGVDGALLTSVSVGPPWDRAGQAPTVDPALVRALWQGGFTPVVSPVATDRDGRLLNCNADTSAGALAGALGADVLVLLSDIDQLRADPDDPTSALPSVRCTEVDAMIASGAAREGMRPKMAAAMHALAGGAARVVLANGTRPHALRTVLTGTIPSTEVLP